MIRNYLETEERVQQISHGGVGPVSLYEIWNKTDFKSNIDFIDRVIVPPKSTIGYHKHGNNEEIYIVLSGQAEMTIDGEAMIVKQGDMILNRPNGQHGLVNNSNEDIDLMVIQVSLAE